MYIDGEVKLHGPKEFFPKRIKANTYFFVLHVKIPYHLKKKKKRKDKLQIVFWV